jgi:hypothetical protein
MTTTILDQLDKLPHGTKLWKTATGKWVVELDKKKLPPGRLFKKPRLSYRAPMRFRSKDAKTALSKAITFWEMT